MSYFSITFVNFNTLEENLFDICYNNSDEYYESAFISKTTFNYLKNIKKEIEKHQIEWDNIKKYVNPYEYIHTQIPDCKSSVSKIKPISRSYYKIIEIVKSLNLLTNYDNTNISTFHLAEGPGGFIEAISYLRQSIPQSSRDVYYGMTLICEDDMNVPGWKKKYFDKNSSIHLLKGASGDGNLLNMENLQYCYDKYKNSMDIITGDGGFDYSIDFNKQELLSVKLILAQIFYAILMQKEKGCFIIKFFDIFYKPTCDMIYFLSYFYEKIYIMKPNTSRFANSEKYIICKNFRNKTNKQELLQTFKPIIHKIKNCNYITNIFNFDLPNIFISKIEEINSILGQQQLECILNTLQLLESTNNSEKLEQLKQVNIQKCITWCTKFNIPYHKIIQQTNIFLERE